MHAREGGEDLRVIGLALCQGLCPRSSRLLSLVSRAPATRSAEVIPGQPHPS